MVLVPARSIKIKSGPLDRFDRCLSHLTTPVRLLCPSFVWCFVIGSNISKLSSLGTDSNRGVAVLCRACCPALPASRDNLRASRLGLGSSVVSSTMPQRLRPAQVYDHMVAAAVTFAIDVIAHTCFHTCYGHLWSTKRLSNLLQKDGDAKHLGVRGARCRYWLRPLACSAALSRSPSSSLCASPPFLCRVFTDARRCWCPRRCVRLRTWW